MCFRVSNSAEVLSSYSIPANNLKVTVNTSAMCKTCNSITNLQVLSGQNNGDVCEDILVSKDSKVVDLKVNVKYDALGISLGSSTEFVCDKVGETNYANTYTCNKK